MEVRVLNPVSSKPLLFEHDSTTYPHPHPHPRLRSHSRLSSLSGKATNTCFNYGVMERLSVESMEDLFDGATQTHTEDTISSQVPKSLEQKLLDDVVDPPFINPSPNSNFNASQDLIDTSNNHEQTPTHQLDHVKRFPLVTSNSSNTTLSSALVPASTPTPTPTPTLAPSSNPAIHSSPDILPNQGNLYATTISQSDTSTAAHIIIDKASIPGINLAPSAFINNSYLTDTDDKTNSHKSKEPMHSSAEVSPLSPPARRHSQSTPGESRTTDITEFKHLLYGRTKSRSLHEIENTTTSPTRTISALGEILGGSMMYGFGKLLHKKQWQEEGLHSQQEGRWRFRQARHRHN